MSFPQSNSATLRHSSWLDTGFPFRFFQPCSTQPESHPCSNTAARYPEPVYRWTETGLFTLSSAFLSASASMWFLVPSRYPDAVSVTGPLAVFSSRM